MRLTLHLLANLDIDLEELGYAAVEADGFTLVEIGFAVRCVYAFGCAGFDEAGAVEVSRCLFLEKTEGRREGEGGVEGRFVTYRLYMSETMSISASACAIFCSEEIWGF